MAFLATVLGVLLGLAILAIAVVWSIAWNTGDYVERVMVCPEDGKEYRYRIKPFHWLPKLTPWHEDAITLGDQMFCLDECPPDLEAHEFLHVKKNSEYGKVERFVVILRDYATRGYFRAIEETLARAYSVSWRHLFSGLTRREFDIARGVL